MKVALTISGESESLYIAKDVHTEEELNNAINFFKDCKSSIDGEDVESKIEILGDKLKLANFIKWY